MDAVTDTHGLIWYLEDDPRLGPDAGRAFDDCDAGRGVIYVPTICLVEIVYLQEKGRIPKDMKDRFNARLRSGRTSLVVADLTAAVVDALDRVPRDEVPDLPDRVVVATALHLGVPVISKDRTIQLSSVPAIW